MVTQTTPAKGWRDRVGFPGGLILPLLLPLLLNDLGQLYWPHQTMAAWYWLVDALMYPGLLGLALWIYSRKGWIDLGEYSLKRSRFLLDLLQATWPAMILVVVYFLIHRIAFNLIMPEAWGMSLTIPQSEPWHVLLVLYLAISAGFFEEIIFRGFIFSHLTRLSNSPRVAALVTALLFAAVHWGQGLPGVAGSFVFALLIQAYYNAFRDMRRTIMAHVLCDIWFFW